MDKAYIISRKMVDNNGTTAYAVDCYRNKKRIITRTTSDYFLMLEMIGYYEALLSCPFFKMDLQDSVVCDS